MAPTRTVRTDRPLHHPRPGIYNAVLRSDRFGTGHRHQRSQKMFCAREDTSIVPCDMGSIVQRSRGVGREAGLVHRAGGSVVLMCALGAKQRLSVPRTAMSSFFPGGT